MAELVPCRHVGLFAACAVAGAGGLAVEGLDLTNARSSTVFHAVGGLRVGIESTVGHGLFVAAHVDGLVTLTRTTAAIGTRDLYATPTFAALAAVGAGYAFP
jgi:hypothetical protein